MTTVPFAPGFISGHEEGLEAARLVGVSCSDCGVVLFGERDNCENCGSDGLEPVEFDTSGEIHSFTVQRAPPTPPFAMGPTDRDEWVPRPVGYVDIPPGGRILSVLEGPHDAIEIGAPVSLVVEPGWETDEGDEVLVYKFALEGTDE
jgi:uncharacterized OB-fold protein